MKRFKALLYRLRHPTASPAASPQSVLAGFREPDADSLTLIRRLVFFLRPQGTHDDQSNARYAAMLDVLEADAGLRDAFRHHLLRFIADRWAVTFFTDSGILPGTGFFSEWWRILVHRILPAVPDERRLNDCLGIVFDHADDWLWLEQLPAAHAERFWAMLLPSSHGPAPEVRALIEQMLDAMLLLAHRISGLGVDSELMRATPDFESHLPRFVSLSAEALDFVNALRATLDVPEQEGDDGSQLLVIIDQCQDTLERIRKRALTVGTSLRLSYQLARGTQSLERLSDLTEILRLIQARNAGAAACATWSEFARRALVSENRRNSLGAYVGQLSRLMAMRVTENAASSGEHYICSTKSEYRGMWLSAAGAGVFISIMALLKIFASGLHAPLFVEAILYSLIYGVGFVVIYLLGMTVATKQPAMTAQTLASLLDDVRPTRSADLERLVDVVAAVSRSQLAAIFGNVLVAVPVALLIGAAFYLVTGAMPVSTEKAAYLLADLDLLSWALPHAAIAGIYLYLSGLLTGYFDNYAAYAGIGPRVGRLRWVRGLLGKRRATAFGDYVQERLGGIMGNFLFGCMLGSTGVIGTILGLPLDIRHIAFSSANLGYAMIGSQFHLTASTIVLAGIGVAAIGFTNLLVSFTLALRTAMRARDIRFEHWGTLLGALGRRLYRQPHHFLLPPRDPDPAAPEKKTET